MGNLSLALYWKGEIVAHFVALHVMSGNLLAMEGRYQVPSVEHQEFYRGAYHHVWRH
jgi:hypothetical protein